MVDTWKRSIIYLSAFYIVKGDNIDEQIRIGK